MQISIQPSMTFKGRHNVVVTSYGKTMLDLKDMLIGNLEDLEGEFLELISEISKYRREHSK